MLDSNTKESQRLFRRGFDLGTIGATPSNQTCSDFSNNWNAGKPVFLKQQCLQALREHQEHFSQSKQLYQAVLDEQDCSSLLDEHPYIERLKENFESLGSCINEGDSQEIETVLFDAIKKEQIIAEDLWMKASWLSFHEEDASLRFRFSFGIDLHEDVAADEERQYYASLLSDAIFPESTLITKNNSLIDKITSLLKCNDIRFVERIIYFNSPQGGAYLHHDRERGHAGVVYAQLSGNTFWLALTRSALVEEIITFVSQCQNGAWPETITKTMQTELKSLTTQPNKLIAELESFSNSTLIHLINETACFVQQLITQGYSKTLKPGDILLLPQETEEYCCWHSVFNLGETSGEALSFAIRRS